MSKASPALTTTIEIEIPARVEIYSYIYTCVQKNVWQPPEGKCATYCVGITERVLWLPHSQTPYLKVAFDMAMRWCEQLKSETKRTKREERNNFGKRKGHGTKTERLKWIKRAA